MGRRGWFGQRARHSEAAKRGWLHRMREWHFKRRLDKIEKKIIELEVSQEYIQALEEGLKDVFGDKKGRVVIFTRPPAGREVRHRIELIYDPVKEDYEVVDIGRVVARQLGGKTVVFAEEPRKRSPHMKRRFIRLER